jgi:hypothetical protein
MNVINLRREQGSEHYTGERAESVSVLEVD